MNYFFELIVGIVKLSNLISIYLLNLNNDLTVKSKKKKSVNLSYLFFFLIISLQFVTVFSLFGCFECRLKTLLFLFFFIATLVFYFAFTTHNRKYFLFSLYVCFFVFIAHYFDSNCYFCFFLCTAG